MRRFAALAIGLSISGFAVVVIGSPPKPTTQPPKVVAECPTPDADKCVEEDYLESKCGLQHSSICEPHVVAALEVHYLASSAPKRKMLPPGESELPADLTQGRYYAYKPSPKFTKLNDFGKVYRKVSDPILSHLGMSASKDPPIDRLGSVDPATAAAHHRQPSWDANGDTVESCAEYAYERSYDVTRFIDAATACRGDRECMFDVAYMAGSPGIAKRKLSDTAGVELLAGVPGSPGQIPLAKGWFPKNDMFVLGAAMVRANGTQPMTVTQDMLDLEAALQTGHQYYGIGLCTGNQCNTTNKFKDEWHWHERLHTLTANVEQAEFEEYEARRAEFRALFEQLQAAVAHEYSVLNQNPKSAPIVLPFDMRAHSPFERYEIEQHYIERGRDQFQQIEQKFGADIFDKNLVNAKKQVLGSRSGGSGFATGVLAAPAPTTPDSNKPKANGGGGSQISQCSRTTGWGLEMNGKGQLSCMVGQFLRNEWARKKAGHKSCLDVGNSACDWTLDMFKASILDVVPTLERQLADERVCKAWQDGATFPANSVTQAKDRLTANEVAFALTWPLVKEFDRGTTSNGRKFGKDWTGGDYLGDKDWFAVGYDFDLGWDVASLGKDGEGVVCQLGGSIHADTGFDAWIIGKKVEVVDGAVRAESNFGGNNKVRYNAHLEMFDQSVFSTANEPDDWKVAQTFAPDSDMGLGVVLPKPKPRFDVYVGVPISGEMWGELMFGSGLTMSGKASSACTPDSPTFAIKAGYMPFFASYGIGQVGVGISGIVSAGIRATLTLIYVGVPVELGMSAKTKSGKQVLAFDSSLSLMLSTLAGRVSLYIEFLMFDEEFELFRWNGIGPFTAPLMPRLTVEVPLSGMN